MALRRSVCNGVCACLYCVMKQEDGLQWRNVALRHLSRHRMSCDDMKEDAARRECGMWRGEGKCIQGFGVET
jgi:hypothetical protein